MIYGLDSEDSGQTGRIGVFAGYTVLCQSFNQTKSVYFAFSYEGTPRLKGHKA